MNMSFMSLMWSTFQKHPAMGNCAVGGIMCTGADLFAQHIESVDPMEVDRKRLFTAGLIGALFTGYVYPFGYARIDALFAGKAFPTVVKKALFEIFTVGLFVNTVSMGTRGVAQGRPVKQVSHHVAKELPRVTFNDCRFWLPYNVVAFRFIPPTVRPVTTAVMEACWQTYISLRANACTDIGFAEESLVPMA